MKLKRYRSLFIIGLECLMLLILTGMFITNSLKRNKMDALVVTSDKGTKNYIKWVDFSVTYDALDDAYHYDLETHDAEIKLHWIELLAYLGGKYGGDFSRYKSSDMKKVADMLLSGEETIGTLTEDMKYYPYYYEAYSAVLSGLVGEYEIQVATDDKKNLVWEKRYGLKAYSPIARDYYFYHYDDFGVSRSYGYKRKHLGHDLMGQVGTPIIAVESGYVEAIGWNQYGGWRIGIRSFDGKRYYYYAHLRKDMPYNSNLSEGSIVTAGEVIGYLGRTGYSAKENTNNISTAHLHFGLQLIFDESQKEGYNEIWVDCYDLTRFLYRNRSLTTRDENSNEYKRVYDMRDPAVEYYKKNMTE